MNQYDQQFIFRKAKIIDVTAIMQFIREYWRENHILGNDTQFFLYEYAFHNEVNFVLCEEKESNKLVGIHGFIPYSHDPENKHICGAMTMVKKSITVPMLGVELIKRFILLTGYKTYCGIGTNKNTMVPLVKRLFKRYAGTMQHYYHLNDEIQNFKIARINDRKFSLVENHEIQSKLVLLSNFEELKGRFELNKPYPFLPYKEDWYLKKRYFDHPIYQYKIFGIDNNDSIVALLIGREVTYCNAKILRLVDFIGNIKVLKQIRDAVGGIIKENQYEYVDFLLHGVPVDIMNQAGFVLKNDDVNIIPNYFEPFVLDNVEIWFETSVKNMILFRADADADRPNQRFYNNED